MERRDVRKELWKRGEGLSRRVPGLKEGGGGSRELQRMIGLFPSKRERERDWWI